MAQSADAPSPKRSAGTFSGAGESLQGLIAATTKKDSGLVKPVADAINYLIQNGQYQAWLTAWNLGNEAVKTSRGQPARPAHHQHVIDAHAVRRIRRMTRAPNRSAVSGTRSSTAWNWPKASNPSGTRSGVNP